MDIVLVDFQTQTLWLVLTVAGLFSQHTFDDMYITCTYA